MSSIPCSVTETSLNSKSSNNLPWKEALRSASFRTSNSEPFSDFEPQEFSLLEASDAADTEQSASSYTPEIRERNSLSTAEGSETRRRKSKQRISLGESQMWLAVYVTLAQVSLAFVILLLYGFFKLLEEYLRPIVWASLCSIPLRGIQDILFEFWSEPLKVGLTDAIMAVPIAISRACLGTIIDARDVTSCVFYSEKLKEEVGPEKNGFLRLVRRLVSFSLFVLAYEQIGRFGALTLIGLGIMFSSNLPPSTLSLISTLRSDSFSIRSNTYTLENKQKKLHLEMISRGISRWILSRLKTILAVALILGMIIGGLAGAIFFSYRIGAEGKDAVISLKSHLEENKYAQKMGIKKWVYENNAMEIMDWYTFECYETLLQQIDNFASDYYLSELVEVIKQFVTTPNSDHLKNSSISQLCTDLQETKYTLKLKNLIPNPVFSITKCFATQDMDMHFEIISSCKFIQDGSAYLLLYIGQSIVSWALGLIQFLIQSTVFFWVLYNLLTSESGGVTEQVMEVIPISKPIKLKCINSLNNAISGVLLATTEIAFFQGCFTWLLCRLFSTHFVYVSTLLAFFSPLLPIFPPWLATLVGGVELVLDGRYVLSIGFCITHIAVMDYAASEIAVSVPGYTTYLTGVSIIGGITLFPSALEGAIMGPLITTVVIALKDLYTEFVLNEPKEKIK